MTLEFYERRFDRLLAAIFAGGFVLLILSAFTGTGRDLINGDAAESFEYARSVVVEGRLPTTLIRFPCGVPMIGAIAYAPAYFAVKALVSAGIVTSTPRLISGWSLPLQAAYCLPMLVLSFLAFRANVSMLRRLGYEGRVVKPMVLFWIVVTNVGYYALKDPAMTEGATYSTLSFYYWALIQWFYVPPAARDESRPAVTAGEWTRRALVTGLFLGLAGIVRQQSILHSLSLPLILWTQSRYIFGPDRRAIVSSTARVIGLAAAVSAVLFVVPWVPWYRASGSFRLMSYTQGHFNWLSPQPLKVLFVPGYHGLFLFHPAFLLATIGLVFFLGAHRDLLPVWMTAIVVQLYLLSTWYWLSLGASIGHRGFFTIFPLLLAGFVAFADFVIQRGKIRQLIAGLWLLGVGNAAVSLLVLIHVLDPQGHGYPANSGF